MLVIDGSKCNGCGNCVDACPRQAITISNGVARINHGQCIQCGTCLDICPMGAVKEIVPSYTQSRKGGDTMVYGYGRGSGRGMGRGGGAGMGRGGGAGFGRRGGAGFGFRGQSPDEPYVGRGRGGLPRCWYPGAATASPYTPVTPYYDTGTTQEGELDRLRSQAEDIKAELGRIEARMRDLESSE